MVSIGGVRGMSISRSKIGYCDYSSGDANFITGCTPVSEGCRNCYARAIYERFGLDFSQARVHEDRLDRLYAWQPRPPWKRDRPSVFVCDTGDLFHEAVPFEFIDDAVSIMNQRSDIDWLILTKRPVRMLAWWRQTHERLGDNLWIGVTAENQTRAEERIPLLLELPAAVRWVSVEPMLTPVDLFSWLPDVDWIVCGGESGPKRRPFEVSWALDLYEQCQWAGTPFWYKQGSAFRPGQDAKLPDYGVVQQWPIRAKQPESIGEVQ